MSQGPESRAHPSPSPSTAQTAWHEPARYRNIAPPMLFYFDFGIWSRMLRLALREDPKSRRWLLSRLLFTVPLIATFHAICFFLDGLLFPRLHRVKVRTPVFMVGHARSGTTLLHRIMSEDERFSSFDLWELYFPSLLQKKLIRAAARFDRAVLGGFLARRVKAWEDEKYGATRDIHAMSLGQPEEDDIVLYYSCAAGFWTTKLPYLGDLDFFYVDTKWSPRRRRRMLRFYADCVKRQLLLNGPDKIHLSKNPTFAGRVEALVEAFPDARIVLNMRTPYETIPSLLKLLAVSYRLRGWSEEKIRASLRAMAEISFDTYLHPFEALARHPETKSAVVDYDALVAEPEKTLREVYTQLGFPLSPAFEQVLAREQARARTKKHATGHTYSLEEFGLARDAIRTRLAGLFDRFGWSDGGGAHDP